MFISPVCILFFITGFQQLAVGLSTGNGTYTNPILDQQGADPWVKSARSLLSN